LNDPALAKLPRRTTAEARTALAIADKQMQEARTALERDDYARAMSAASTVATRVAQATALLAKPAPPPATRKRR
jgi:hypothetical protein